MVSPADEKNLIHVHTISLTKLEGKNVKMNEVTVMAIIVSPVFL